MCNCKTVIRAVCVTMCIKWYSIISFIYLQRKLFNDTHDLCVTNLLLAENLSSIILRTLGFILVAAFCWRLTYSVCYHICMIRYIICVDHSIFWGAVYERFNLLQACNLKWLAFLMKTYILLAVLCTITLLLKWLTISIKYLLK